jgi:hypothetical protein
MDIADSQSDDKTRGTDGSTRKEAKKWGKRQTNQSASERASNQPITLGSGAGPGRGGRACGGEGRGEEQQGQTGAPRPASPASSALYYQRRRRHPPPLLASITTSSCCSSYNTPGEHMFRAVIRRGPAALACSIIALLAS